jgi:hypothetical protein
MREAAPRGRVTDVAKQNVQFELDAWWWAGNKIGRDLRELCDVPKDLPPELLTLVRKLDESDLLFPAISWRNDIDFLP